MIRARWWSSIVAVVAAFAAGWAASAPAVAAGAAKPRAKTSCAAGTTPITSVRRDRVVLARDRRGRLKCRKARAVRPPRPVDAAAGQLGQTADELRDALAVNPRAVRRLEAAIGRSRARRLVEVALTAWRTPAARSRAAGALRFSPIKVDQTFAVRDGVGGSVKLDAAEVAGADTGIAASTEVEITATRAGIAGLSKDAAAALPADVTGATAGLSASFKETGRACAEKGKKPGKLTGKAKLTLTLQRAGKPPTTTEVEAEVTASYTATTDDAGAWTGVDGLDVSTSLRTSATGEASQVYRSRSVGSGFTTASSLDAKSFSTAFDADSGRLDPAAGGTFGPKGGWPNARPYEITFGSIANVKAMVASSVANRLALQAVLEYLRKITRQRSEKGVCGGRYRLVLQVDGRGVFATHDAAGKLALDVIAEPVGGDPKTARAWTVAAPAPWTALTFTSKTDCAYVDPITRGTLRFDLARTDAGALRVTWTTDEGGGQATVSVDCPGDPDPPPIPGQGGLALVNTGPLAFELPVEGGSQAISGGVTDGGDGFTNTGTLVVTRLPS